MQVTYAGLSSAGPVRPNNEDFIAYYEPATPEQWRTRAAAAVLADGVGGHEHGEVASRVACEQAIRVISNSDGELSANQLLARMFEAANNAVYERGHHHGESSRMMTTLTISLFRNNEISVGHVGDCRALIIQQGRIRRVTNDHSYTGVQEKLGLIGAVEAANSPLRSVLTRSIGLDPFIRLDYHRVVVSQGDYLVQCTDGLWCFVTEKEILEVVTRRPPEQASAELIDLALKRGSDDNLTIQIVRIEAVERVSYYRGVRIYHPVLPASSDADLQVGQTLDDRYEITDLISRSGMASIFKAVDRKTGLVVALKVPLMQYESDPAFYSRFQREAAIGSKLDHPYVLRFEVDGEAQRSRPYIVMEFLDGQTLGHLMRSMRVLPTADAVGIASRICQALQYLHEHDVVHRDLKPENVMICNDGSIRIMDFGIAKYEGARRLTFGRFSPTMGTPDYMAPEQVKGRRGDRRTDVYSLGAILYEMVTGALPFEGENPFAIMNARLTGDPVGPRHRNPSLSPQVEEIILHAMEREPDQRYATADEMKAHLDAPRDVQLTGRAQRLKEPAAWNPSRARRRLFLLILGIAILGAVVWFLMRHVHVTLH